MDRRMQWPTPTVTSATVSPAGDIPGEGGNYTVTINGVMPQGGIPVRAYAGGSAIASGTITASGRGVTLNVPANSLTANRTVAFQYQDERHVDDDRKPHAAAGSQHHVGFGKSCG